MLVNRGSVGYQLVLIINLVVFDHLDAGFKIKSAVNQCSCSYLTLTTLTTIKEKVNPMTYLPEQLPFLLTELPETAVLRVQH